MPCQSLGSRSLKPYPIARKLTFTISRKLTRARVNSSKYFLIYLFLGRQLMLGQLHNFLLLISKSVTTIHVTICVNKLGQAHIIFSLHSISSFSILKKKKISLIDQKLICIITLTQ